ncbi:type III secretion system stator protein SctL [Vibrio mangrovi]|uniref:Type III secretion system stator protein SctL n=1 Tax=Vibrio mangrovi TaxID=474394 RepID=A0ABU4I255_9VIBR|nr:type III secretion system stator protein SctL [Vibrio mangrovi]MDW6001949.1 type III secretion system stator protein SctL [Vibrio mangrovi]
MRRQIKMPVPEQAVIGPLLKADLLQACFASDDILNDARQRAADIIEEAHQQAEQIVREAVIQAESISEGAKQDAEQQVWNEANGLISGLQQAEEQLWAGVEESASQVLNSVLASVLNDVGHQDRIRLLVQKLVATQRQSHKGILYCASGDQNLVADVLEEQHLSFWQAEVDNGLNAGELRLETDMGLFRCSWEVLRQALVSCDGASDN